MRTRFIEKEWKGILVVVIALIIFSVIHSFFWPYSDYNPLDPEPKTGADIMAERWPQPEPNDPNFLRDYEEYTGHKWGTD